MRDDKRSNLQGEGMGVGMGLKSRITSICCSGWQLCCRSCFFPLIPALLLAVMGLEVIVCSPACWLLLLLLLPRAGRKVSGKCTKELVAFKVDRSSNINKDVPLGMSLVLLPFLLHLVCICISGFNKKPLSASPVKALRFLCMGEMCRCGVCHVPAEPIWGLLVQACVDSGAYPVEPTRGWVAQACVKCIAELAAAWLLGTNCSGMCVCRANRCGQGCAQLLPGPAPTLPCAHPAPNALSSDTCSQGLQGRC